MFAYQIMLKKPDAKQFVMPKDPSEMTAISFAPWEKSLDGFVAAFEDRRILRGLPFGEDYRGAGIYRKTYNEAVEEFKYSVARLKAAIGKLEGLAVNTVKQLENAKNDKERNGIFAEYTAAAEKLDKQFEIVITGKRSFFNAIVDLLRERAQNAKEVNQQIFNNIMGVLVAAGWAAGAIATSETGPGALVGGRVTAGAIGAAGQTLWRKVLANAFSGMEVVGGWTLGDEIIARNASFNLLEGEQVKISDVLKATALVMAGTAVLMGTATAARPFFGWLKTKWNSFTPATQKILIRSGFTVGGTSYAGAIYYGAKKELKRQEQLKIGMLNELFDYDFDKLGRLFVNYVYGKESNRRDLRTDAETSLKEYFDLTGAENGFAQLAKQIIRFKNGENDTNKVVKKMLNSASTETKSALYADAEEYLKLTR